MTCAAGVSAPPCLTDLSADEWVEFLICALTAWARSVVVSEQLMEP